MLADDGYQWFVEHGGLTRENGQRFREAILSRGNSTDLAELYRQWRGHDPQIEPMLENRGLVSRATLCQKQNRARCPVFISFPSPKSLLNVGGGGKMLSGGG